MKFLCALALSMTALSTALAADVYPSKSITMITAFPAGGPTDTNARLLGRGMGDDLGQAIVIDAKPGGGSTIASNYVVQAKPDGYTILYNTSSLLLGKLMYSAAKFDPLTDFVPVARTVGVPLVVAVNPSVPAGDLNALSELAKSKPGELNYASSGTGTIDHLAGALLAKQLGIDMMHVPYKGTAPALIDVAGGRVDLMVATLNTLLPYFRDERLKPLAIASLNRSPLLPDVPTVAESIGVPGFEITAWNGIVAPAGTPQAVVERLNLAVNNVLRDASFIKQYHDSGAEIYGGGSEDYGKYLKSELERWQTVIDDIGIQPQ
ncbi:tripartite tricarboxylate transporter substrate binding protein [Alcaligenaceae bacterium]|nr:tripartite tricarboxylate transporter substrate binding protein [Alcaligenaceae bacterium]